MGSTAVDVHGHAVPADADPLGALDAAGLDDGDRERVASTNAGELLRL